MPNNSGRRAPERSPSSAGVEDGTALLQLGQLVGLEMYGTCTAASAATVSALGGTPIHDRRHDFVEEVRGRGLWAGIQLVESARPARRSAERLLQEGVLAKDTHESTLRLAPPLVISQEELEWGLERILPVLASATDG